MNRVAFPCLMVVLLIFAASAVRGESVEWIRQLGTSTQDPSEAVSADGLGNVYIAGSTQGSLGGPNAGGSDAFVSKYNGAGTLQWTRQLGTSTIDTSRGVSADGLGNVYVSGFTLGSLSGTNAGFDDAFVSKYDAAGTLQWTRQLGTSSNDGSYGVSADGLGNVYISGYTFGSLGGPNAGSGDAFISKYDAAGNVQWTRQLGTSSVDESYGVSADGLGNVYISGRTFGSLGGPTAGSDDAFVSKYDAAGTLQWSRQLGTNALDWSFDVSADGLGNVYISGYTYGSLGGPNAGVRDAFVSKYDAAGTLQWSRQLGTNSYDESHGVSADGLGNVYISGSTSGSLGGPFAGVGDVFVSKYDAAGTFMWSLQLGTSSNDGSTGVSADGLGKVYFSGYTDGSLGGPYAGDRDAFVAKIADVPEPSAILLLVFGAVGALLVCWRIRAAPQLVAAAIFASVAVMPLPARAVTYTASLLHPSGFSRSEAFDISGTIQVGKADNHAMLWTGTAASVVDLNPAGFDGSVAFGVSGASQVGYGTATGGGLYRHALLWNGTAASAVDLNPAGFDYSEANDVSGGSQVGYGHRPATGFKSYALLWHGTAASAVDLTPAGFLDSLAEGISGTSQVGNGNVLTSQGIQWHALLWNGTAASAVDLHPAGFTNSGAVGVSGASQVGSGWIGNTSHALLWHGTAASAVDLHPPGFTSSSAVDVSGSIQVGSGWGPATGGQHALMWNGTASSVVDLHALLSGLGPTFVNSFTNGIAENGAIVGTASDGFGTPYAVMWTPVPEPRTNLLLSLGVLGVLAIQRRLGSMRWLRGTTLALCLLAGSAAAHAVTIPTVPIGNPGNAGDTQMMVDGTSGYGSVGYSFRMGKTEVTNSQYVGFLNAVAASDPYQLYTTSMAISPLAGIVRDGVSGSYTYAVKPAAVGQGPGGSDHTYGDKPVNFVSWFTTLRFANWLHNGQGGSGTTEDGAYTLLGGTPVPSNASSITRNSGARWWLPDENEWYKAAYHKNDGVTANYWDYPTGTDSTPVNNLPANDDGNSMNTGRGYISYPATNAGAFQLSVSPYSTLDQGGNVLEWNETLIYGQYRGVRGGCYFDNITAGQAAGRAYYTPGPADNTVGFRVATIPDLPGDFNHDGTVDAADYIVWRKNPGGIYTQDDYNTWRANFGRSFSVDGSASRATAGWPSSAIPEPSPLGLFLAAIITLRLIPRSRGMAKNCPL